MLNLKKNNFYNFRQTCDKKIFYGRIYSQYVQFIGRIIMTSTHWIPGNNPWYDSMGDDKYL